MAGTNAVVCACVTAPTAATAGHRIIQLWVDILRTAGNTGSSVHQGERHTATLDQKSPPKPSTQVSVLKKRGSAWVTSHFDAILYYVQKVQMKSTVEKRGSVMSPVCNSSRCRWWCWQPHTGRSPASQSIRCDSSAYRRPLFHPSVYTAAHIWTQIQASWKYRQWNS